MNIHANPDHFEKAFNHCLINKFSDKMALIMAEGYRKRCLIDAYEGCLHYVLNYKMFKIDQKKEKKL